MKVRELMAILYSCDPESVVETIGVWVGEYKCSTDELMIVAPNGDEQMYIDLETGEAG